MIRRLIVYIKNKLVNLIFSRNTDPIKNAQRWRDKGVNIGPGTYVYPNVVFGRGGMDPITIGSNCVLTSGCTILGHDASTNKALGLSSDQRSMIMPVVIEDDCFIGVRSIILMGTRIGKGSIVGAGAVVTSDVPPGSVVAGNPAKVICTVKELVEKRRQLAIDHPEFFPDKPTILR